LEDGRVWKRHVDQLKRAEVKTQKEVRQEEVREKSRDQWQMSAPSMTDTEASTREGEEIPRVETPPHRSAIVQESTTSDTTAASPTHKRQSQRNRKPPRRLIEEV
jgi:hypothetical protein